MSAAPPVVSQHERDVYKKNKSGVNKEFWEDDQPPCPGCGRVENENENENGIDIK